MLASCAVVLVFLAAIIWVNRPTPTHHHGSVGIEVAIAVKAPFVPAVASGGTTTTFSGKASQSGLVFNGLGGLTILHATCVCSTNFVVVVNNPQGAAIDYPVNVIGGYDAVQPITAPKGKDRLSVIATGPWKLVVVQPSAAARPLASPFSFPPASAKKPSSAIEDVVGPFRATDSKLTFRFVPLEGGNVTVYALNVDGQATGFGRPLLTWATERASTETLRGMPDPYYLEVVASGFWVLSVGSSTSG